jgi:hypothetical protein
VGLLGQPIDAATVKDGHAIGVQKKADGSYLVMDPNVGEFHFQNDAAMADFFKDLANSCDYSDNFRGMILLRIT